MIILPAIDLKDGQCVRLQKGEFQTAQQVAASATETAARFRDAGAVWIHMVDLDGAREGVRKNSPIIRAVMETSGLKLELGGGLKTEADLQNVMDAGVARAVIGSAAVSNPELVKWSVTRWPDRTAVGIDALNDRVRTAGWEQDSGLDAVGFTKQVAAMGVKFIVFTDIATDGMLSGPSFDRLAAVRKAAPGIRIVASGGVTTLDDVKRLRDMGLFAAIIGKAYYAGTVDLAQAIREAGDQNAL